MKTRTGALAVFLVLFSLHPFQVSAQQSGEPLWLRMERGISFFDEGRLGDALRIFRTVVEEDPSYANAHMWIGNILAAEGEYEAAKKKYEDALAPGRSFFPDSERISAYYRLAEVAISVDDLEGAAGYLDRVLDQGRTEEFPEPRRKAMVSKFRNEGPDKTLELYRLTDKAVRRAYQLRGEIELRRDRYDLALENLLFSLMTTLSLAIETQMIYDPEYMFIRDELNPGKKEFSTVNTARLLREINQHENLQRYFDEVGAYRQLFLLGMAFLGMNNAENAQDIWLLITDHRRAGIWYEFAREQIGGPDISLLSAALQYR